MQHILNSSNMKNNGKNKDNNLILKAPSSLRSLFNHLVRLVSHMIILENVLKHK